MLLICNNSNISVRNFQAFYEDLINISLWSGCPAPATFVPAPVPSYLPKRITRFQLAILQEICRYIGNHESAWPSHDTIAKKVGCSRITVLRAMDIFEHLEMLTIIHRNLKHETNVYSLGPVLMNKSFQFYARNVITNLKYAIINTLKRMFGEFFDIEEFLGVENKVRGYNAVNKPNDTLLTNVKFLKEKSIYTIDSKRDKLVNLGFTKEVYTQREYSQYKREQKKKQFLKSERGLWWKNRNIAMWADWSLTREDFKEVLW